MRGSGDIGAGSNNGRIGIERAISQLIAGLTCDQNVTYYFTYG
jgi:hypothetical protein